MKGMGNEDWENGWLTGLVDGEGFITIRYRSDRETMFPRIRIYCTVKPILDRAGWIMGVNPFPRRDYGKLVGWYVSASHQKALKVLREIGPLLTEPSKKCRAMKILREFGNKGTIGGKAAAAEFFKDCPPPTRLRNPPKNISSESRRPFQRGGEARYIPAGS